MTDAVREYWPRRRGLKAALSEIKELKAEIARLTAERDEWKELYRRTAPASTAVQADLEAEREAVLDMKMSATNALAEAWLSDPLPSVEDANAFFLDSLKIIQHRGIEAMSARAKVAKV